MYSHEEEEADDDTVPPSALFRQLTPQERLTRLDTAQDMLALCQFWRGDPKLSAWQEGFLASLAQRLHISGGRYKVSPKEWVKFWEVRDLVDSDDPEHSGDGDDD